MNDKNNNKYTPWVEKYRPVTINDIVLDPLNKQIMSNIIKTQYFPNLLFYGPPGTGKTTSVINLINAYQETYNIKNKISNKPCLIHLNASDDRGIDIIRNQINNFVNARSLFNNNMKFVILDEIDYMTKTAQVALRYLLQDYTNVRFCLICNYISRVDESLQTEFVRLRFNQLPRHDIHVFLKKINEYENLNYNDDVLHSIHQLFNSDMRSMINYMQSNETNINNNSIITHELWERLINDIQHHDIDYIINNIHKISIEYNCEKKDIIKKIINHIIRNRYEIITNELLKTIESIMHSNVVANNINYTLMFLVLKLKETLVLGS
tara:strand:- start:3256 stop:4224 length:969 start_codon:yes stop_codon:yes gene_type:complete